MIKEIVKDAFLLSQKSLPATKEDLNVVQDLKDTLAFHHERCVGMAANMIGSLKRIIIFQDGKEFTVMLNPKIIKHSDPYYACEEGCLSHEGTRPCTRYEKIKVQYQDEKFKVKIKTYEGWTAQIIQHELDHLEGILI